MSQRVSHSTPQPSHGRAGDAQTPAPGGAAVLDGADLASFEGAADELARRVLSAQMRLGGAVEGAMLVETGAGTLDLLAVVPPTDATPVWLEVCAEGVRDAARSGRAVAGRLPDQDRAVIAVPCGPEANLAGDAGRMVVAFVVETVDPLEVDAARDRLVNASVLAALVSSRLALHECAGRADGLRHAAEVLAATNAHRRFRASAMALVNEIASRLRATRVSLALTRGTAARGGVECVAVSHTERFLRASALVRDLEAAMDEAVDQDTDTAWPHDPQAPYVARQAAEVAHRHGPSSLTVMVLRSGPDHEPVGALAVERETERPVDALEARWLRLALDLVAPRLVELDERDAWLGRRIAVAARRAVSAAGSPRHSAWKLGALVLAAGLASLFFIPTELESRGTFAAVAITRRVIAAPFDGTLAEVRVKVGDHVRAGETILGAIDTTELKLKLSEARAQLEALRRQAEAARAAPSSGAPAVGAIAEARLLEAQADEAQARVGLLESRLARAELRSPIDGVVTAGDIERLRGSAVNLGDTLFEVTAESDLAADVMVPEARAAVVEVGQPVLLRPTGRPDVELRGTVERVHPAAEVVGSRNVVKVRVALSPETPVPKWLRPGMEGVAAIRTGEASIARAWTRDVSDWLRLNLW